MAKKIVEFGEPDDVVKIATRELAQCLAFAYFATYPIISDNHEINFYSLYSSIGMGNDVKEGQVLTKIKSSNCLSSKYPYNNTNLKKSFKVGMTEKTNKPSYSSLAKKTYNVTKAFIDKGYLVGNPKNYMYLDQNDDFFRLVKTTSLTNIKNALNISYSIDIFSAIDVIFVKKSSMSKIQTEFKKYFTDKDTIIRNAVSGGKSYKNIIAKYMDTQEMFPVSLKLPTTINATPSIKKVQFQKETSITSEDNIDPYTKFLAAIVENPSKTREYINKVVKINFDKFSTGEVLNWVFPVTFEYKSLVDPITNHSLSNYNLNFNLFAQGNSAGWNGQFDASTKKHQDTQWVGGIGIATFEIFASKYPEYNKIISSLVKHRVDIFDSMCKNLKATNPEAFKKNQQKHDIARRSLLQNKILYASVKNKETKDFFDSMDTYGPKNKISLLHQYMLEVTDKIRNGIKPYHGSNAQNEKYVLAHYSHAQISFFLFNGGRGTDLFFKQRMFMTIFGAITKKAHKLIGIDDYMGMRDIIREEVKLKNKTITAQFSTPPHYIIS
jgi:hypothetical protein